MSISTEQRTRQSAPRNGSTEIKGFDHIELYVGNAYQSAHYYRTVFGFTPVAYAGLETGLRDRASFVVRQGDIFLILTSPLGPEGEIAEHVRHHGDGVRDVAFTVDDAKAAFETVVERGARPLMPPTVMEDEEGRCVKATIAAYGDTVHSFVQREGCEKSFLPKFKAICNPPRCTSTGLREIDHVAFSVEPNTLDPMVDFYTHVLDFRQSHQEDISTEYSGMNSKVVEDNSGRIKFPIVAPAKGLRKSQVEEHLEYYRGAGVQHIALLCDDIVETVRALRDNGKEFLCSPDSYYDMLEGRIGKIDEDTSLLRELSILVDRDEWGYLMQIFTKPVQSRPTVFIEVIQRKAAKGFGGGNIKALFQANEREQARRGNL